MVSYCYEFSFLFSPFFGFALSILDKQTMPVIDLSQNEKVIVRIRAEYIWDRYARTDNGLDVHHHATCLMLRCRWYPQTRVFLMTLCDTMNQSLIYMCQSPLIVVSQIRSFCIVWLACLGQWALASVYNKVYPLFINHRASESDCLKWIVVYRI